ncbi:RICIN domain-containing protein [Virgibacillus sp. NKC19-3]|uniref:glycoside hydrolase n=1 Tax=Virgibacillus saliphilus TaxID=2831674 RepID=UPI001C9A68D7|nr:glycoside hydrolase [Virgibacillus sp. NKC19-3]MBY7142884.1 RICIN domain-containing protein [Virgibacillus sp. NKC19-3]
MSRFIIKISKKAFPLGLTVLLLLGLCIPETAIQASESNIRNADKTVKLDPSYQHESFDGWGTALVWFGNVTGGWPDDIKNELADALFGEEGLNLNIARYNIGGEDSPGTEPYMRIGGAVPGYWNRPAEFAPPEDADEDWQEEDDWWDPEDPNHWDWDKDKNQQWWLKAAKNRGANLFEAFSNSPPYFMTESGYTSGNWDSWEDNLRSDQYENFAIYLTNVVEYLQEEIDIDIQTLSPANEPNNGYWGALGRQEGSNWAPASQAKIINETADQLEKLDLDTVVSAMDETNPQVFRENWETYEETTKANVGQMNVHTYWPAQRSSIRDIAKGEGKRLWMSEVDLGPDGIPQDFDNIEPGLALSERISSDIRNLEPEAWVLWQAIEDEINMNDENENMNWGLIHVDFSPEDFDKLEWHKNKKYYTMGNYTKFIRPGNQFINTDNEDTTAAIDKQSNEVVVVHTNHSDTEEAIDFDLSGFETVANSATATPYVTSESENLSEKDNIEVSNEVLSTTVDPKSVTSFVISDVSGVDTSFLNADDNYKLFNVNSELVMDVDGTSLVQNKNNRYKDNQEWMIEKATGGYSHKEKYKIISPESGDVLTDDQGSLILAPDENLAAQQWIISTNGMGEYTFVSTESGQLIEVVGQSSDIEASIGLYKANSGSNQEWKIMQSDMNSIDIKTLVEQFEEQGEFKSDQDALSLKIHLTAVNRYEEKEASEKVIKHMESFKLLLDHQKEEELISERAYDTLYANTEYLITEWE